MGGSTATPQINGVYVLDHRVRSDSGSGLWTYSGHTRLSYVLSEGVQGMAGPVQLAAKSWAWIFAAP